MLPNMFQIDDEIVGGLSDECICRKYRITRRSLAAYKANITRTYHQIWVSNSQCSRKIRKMYHREALRLRA